MSGRFVRRRNQTLLMTLAASIGAPIPLAPGQSAAVKAGNSSPARQMHDINADGVAELLPVNSIAADFNGDGVLELVRHEGHRLYFLSGTKREPHSMELSDRIVNVAARDIDHDGRVDLRVTLASGEFVELTRLFGPLRESPPARSGQGAGGGSTDGVCPNLAEVWNSGSDLNNVWNAVVGRIDDDILTDILTVNWSPATMVVYENDGDDEFRLVFSTPPEAAPPGAFVAVAIGDTDGDGQGEIIGVETSTLNQVFLFESVGDNTYVQRDINISEPDFRGQLGPSKVFIADTDNDGRMEIIFDTSSSTGAGSKVFFYEHSGAIGQNVYRKVFVYETVSYLFNFNIGDSDNDGWQEVVLGFGGFGGFPVHLRRLENTGDNTYVHKMVEPGGIGLALAPTVADFDADGQNELAFGAVVDDQGGGVLVYEAVADDTYELVFAQGGLSGNGISSAAGPLNCDSQMVIGVGTFRGQFDLWRFDGASYVRALDVPINAAGPIRSAAIGAFDGDARPDLMFASHGAGDNISVYESPGSVCDPCDMNCDGTINAFDIEPFLDLLFDPKAVPCDQCTGDVNGDGNINSFDIEPFLRCLFP